MTDREVHAGGYLKEIYEYEAINGFTKTSTRSVDIHSTAIGAKALLIAENLRDTTHERDDNQVFDVADRLIREGFADSQECRTKNDERGFAVEVRTHEGHVSFANAASTGLVLNNRSNWLSAAQVQLFTGFSQGESHPATTVMYFPSGRAETKESPESGNPLYLVVDPQADDYRDYAPKIAIPMLDVCRLETDAGNTLYVPEQWTNGSVDLEGSLIHTMSAEESTVA